MEALNQPVELECIKNRHALDDWLDDCCTRLLHRYPKIDFEADIWDPRKQHGSDVGKVNLAIGCSDKSPPEKQIRAKTFVQLEITREYHLIDDKPSHRLKPSRPVSRGEC